MNRIFCCHDEKEEKLITKVKKKEKNSNNIFAILYISFCVFLKLSSIIDITLLQTLILTNAHKV